MRSSSLSLLAVSPFFIMIFSLTSLSVALVAAPLITFISYTIIVQKNSYSRRKRIRDQVLRDQQAFDNEKRPSPKSEDDDWEQIPSKISSKAATKKTSKSDYDGFIGFFHPFA